jgi:putative acetyltransferase
MAVLPEHQRRGVGAALIEAGLARLRVADCPFVVVLGHHGYYSRFGFVPASRFGLRCEWDVPDDAFMVYPFDSAVTSAAAGLIRYRPEFLMEMPG